MTFHPGIMTLLIGSALITAMVGYATWHGFAILQHWNIQSGSELQLSMERKTYLISTIVANALGFHLMTLFLYVYTADTISPLFVGAMCAAGSLHVNAYGYPALMLKLTNFVLVSLWLVINHIDQQAPDYPLIRFKYAVLVALFPMLILETWVQGAYLIGLKPNVITSCCGTLFSEDARNFLSEWMMLPRRPMEWIWAGTTCLMMTTGLWFQAKRKGAYLFSGVSFIQMPVSIAALFSFIGIYIYELPTHHCPFCILHAEYHSIGYPIYVMILLSVVSGLAIGILHPFRKVKSLSVRIPAVQRKLAWVSLSSQAVFVCISVLAIASSNLSMDAY